MRILALLLALALPSAAVEELAPVAVIEGRAQHFQALFQNQPQLWRDLGLREFQVPALARIAARSNLSIELQPDYGYGAVRYRLMIHRLSYLEINHLTSRSEHWTDEERRELADWYSILPVVPEPYQRTIAAAHALAEIKVAEEHSGRTISFAESLARELASARDAAEKLEKQEPKKIPITTQLQRFQPLISGLEAADPVGSRAHLLNLFDKQRDYRKILSWLNLLQVTSGFDKRYVSGRINALWNSEVVARLDALHAAFSKVGSYWRGKWRTAMTYAPASIDPLLYDKNPAPGGIELFLVRYLLTRPANAPGAGTLEQFFAKNLKAFKSTSHMRSALRLISAEMHHPLPKRFWDQLMSHPPQDKDQRGDLESAIMILQNTKDPEFLLKGFDLDVPMDYDKLLKHFYSRLRDRLKNRLGLSDEENKRILANPPFAWEDSAFSRDLLLASAFINNNETGLNSLKRLLLELSRSSVVSGRIRYSLRYAWLAKEMPRALLDRWQRDEDFPTEAADVTLHVTDDPAMMLRIGEMPKRTCQTCREPTWNNLAGSFLGRVVNGQFRLAYWSRNGHLEARAVLEYVRDDQGRPAMLVEPLYAEGLSTERGTLKNSLLSYARSLGLSTVYFSDEKPNTSVPWVSDVNPLPFSTFYFINSPIYRDTKGHEASAYRIDAPSKSASPNKWSWSWLEIFHH